MIQGVGTGWLIQQRKTDDAAFGQLIAQMKTLDDVRPFMCPKSNGSPKKCEDCPGFRTCEAGQRAVRLANEQTAPVAEKREVKTLPNPSAREKSDQEEFRAACESGNAWYYLMQTRSMSKDAAGELLSRMCRKFPGIAADFGGSRRIMQRPKAVKVEPVAAREQASGIAEEETPSGNPEGPEQAGNGRKPDAAIAARIESVREVQRGNCLAAVQSGDVREFLLAQGRTRHNVTNTISRWRKLFPDLMAEVPRKRGGRRKQEKPEEELPEEEGQEPDDDTVSLADFLNEFDPAEADRREPEAYEEMPQDLPEPPEPETPDVLMPETWKGKEFSDADLTDPITHMKHRAKWLDQEKARMIGIIRQAEEKIAWIDERLEPLLKVIEKW